MKLVSLASATSVTLVGLGGVCGGAALTAKLVSGAAGMKVMILGGSWLGLGFAGLLLLYQLSRRHVIAYLLFVALGINVGGTSMTVFLCLPLFFLYGATSLVGGTLMGYFILMLAYQLWRTRQHFFRVWSNNHQMVLQKTFDRSRSRINVERLIYQLQCNTELYLPGRLQSVSGAVSLCLIISMVVGFNLRHMFPELSAFAWGVPALTLTTMLMQMALLRVLLARKLREFERANGRAIAPAWESD